MKKRYSIWFSLATVLLVLITVLASCSKRSVNNEPPENNLVIAPKITTPGLMQQVEQFRLTITGRDIEPIVYYLSFDGQIISDSVEVPIGELTFTLEAISTGEFGEEIVYYRGVTRATVRPDVTITIEIPMEPVVPLVKLTPRKVDVTAGDMFELDLQVFNIPNMGGITVTIGPEFGQYNVTGASAVPNPALGGSIYFNARPVFDAINYEVFVASSAGNAIVDETGYATLATIRFATEAFIDGDNSYPTLENLNIFTANPLDPLLDTLPNIDLHTDLVEVNITGLPDIVVTFADIDLETEVRRLANVPSGPLYLSDVIWISSLDLVESGVDDLGGIQYLQNLEWLDVSWQGTLTGLDLTPLAGLTGLRNLAVAGSGVSNLGPLANLTQLEYLNLYYNDISNIMPLANMTAMFDLNIQGKGDTTESISSIAPLANMHNLTRLNASFNQITDISVLQNLPNLRYVNLYSNQITDLGPLVANLDFATGDTLDIMNNPLNDISGGQHIQTLQERGVHVIIPM